MHRNRAGSLGPSRPGIGQGCTRDTPPGSARGAELVLLCVSGWWSGAEPVVVGEEPRVTAVGGRLFK